MIGSLSEIVALIANELIPGHRQGFLEVWEVNKGEVAYRSPDKISGLLIRDGDTWVRKSFNWVAFVKLMPQRWSVVNVTGDRCCC